MPHDTPAAYQVHNLIRRPWRAPRALALAITALAIVAGNLPARQGRSS